MSRIRSRHKTLKTFDQVKEVVQWCKDTGYCSHDFETKAEGPYGPSLDREKQPNGPMYEEDEPTMVSLCFQPGLSYGVPLFHKESPFSRKEALQVIQYIGEHLIINPHISKICWNLKFEYRWWLRYGFTPLGELHDGMLMKYLLDEERPHGLKPFVQTFFPDFGGYDDEVDKLKSKYKGWGNIPLKPLSKYCCLDSDLTFRIVLFLEPKLIRGKFYQLYRNMCMMQTRVLAESESMGMLVDRPYLQGIVNEYEVKIRKNKRRLLRHPLIEKFQRWRRKQKCKKLIREMKSEIKSIKLDSTRTSQSKATLIRNREEKIMRYVAGNLQTKKEIVEDFNPNSPDQLVDLLFRSPRGFNFDIVKYTLDDHKQPTNRPSTDEEVLLELQKKDKSKFIEQLLHHREITKLHSTYMVAPLYRLTKKSVLHSSFLIHGTVTGRLSSKNINMQNIPRDTTSSVVKRMFIPPPGHLLLEVDYGQAELRVVAEMAKDKALIEIFKKGYNVHLATGLKIIHEFQRYEEIKKLLKNPDHPDLVKWEKVKKRGKVLNFSILYLQSDEMTADQMGCDIDEAVEMKEEWFNAFAQIKPWMKQQEIFVKKHGYVMNLFGRKRRLPDIYDPRKGVQNKAIRDAVNAPIQGASSDFTQFSTIILREKIKTGELKLTNDPYWNKQAYTVHDSIGFYIEPKFIEKAVPIIESVCSDPETEKYFGFKMHHVKMKVSAELGTSWGTLREYNTNEDYMSWLNKK